MAAVTYPCIGKRRTQNDTGIGSIYYASNREDIARSSEYYVRRDDCDRSIEIVKGSKAHPVFYSA